MSRTIKRTKGAGYEYWSRRPFAGWRPGKMTKIFTHKYERRVLNARAIRDAKSELS